MVNNKSQSSNNKKLSSGGAMSSALKRDLVKELRCSWKDANGLVVQAEKELKISTQRASLASCEKVKQRAKQLWDIEHGIVTHIGEVKDVNTPPEAAPTAVVVDAEPIKKEPEALHAEAVAEEVNPAEEEETPKKKKKKASRVAPRNARKIKSKGADLRVVLLKKTDDEESDDDEEEDKDANVRWYHCSTMAEHSNYIDSAIGVKIVNDDPTPFEIKFDDIDVETWDLMMMYLDPIESRFMKAPDVLLVAEHYDTYDFPLARRLCDQVLKEHFESEALNERDTDVDLLIDAVAVAYRAHLDEAYAVGNKLVKERLSSYKNGRFSAKPHIPKVVKPVATTTSTGPPPTTMTTLPSKKRAGGASVRRG